MGNLIRFMSTRELNKFLKGETISNKTDWNKDLGMATESKGVCFFPADPKPESRLHYLSGVVTFDKVVEFSPCGNLPGIRMTKGRYRDPDRDNITSLLDFRKPIPRISVDEICMPQYNSRMLYPVRIGYVHGLRLFNGDFTWVIDWLSSYDMAIMRGTEWQKKGRRNRNEP
ncbi:hypothetical protein [Porcincola intestinalis]|uniref:hypothetical protein n=1 Tax=Porcincola intestinalis TaxID=2606632 RepID=UPI002A91F396|nr:hypothetical protein [Porcincola intestinalis]MDY5579981.1 hypothetical protein [Porcincola intestinalis]